MVTVLVESIYNNHIVKMRGHARGRSGGRHRWQAASADRLLARIEGSGGRPGAWLTAGSQAAIEHSEIVACADENVCQLSHVELDSRNFHNQ